MNSKFNKLDASQAISNLKKWYPEIAPTVEGWFSLFADQESDHVVELCAMIREVCLSYQRKLKALDKQLTELREENAQLKSSLMTTHLLPPDEYAVLMNSINTVRSRCKDEVTLNLDGATITFNPKAKVEMCG